jgi:hypothetical protein
MLKSVIPPLVLLLIIRYSRCRCGQKPATFHFKFYNFIYELFSYFNCL